MLLQPRRMDSLEEWARFSAGEVEVQARPLLLVSWTSILAWAQALDGYPSYRN